jgi:meiosis-specific APC/C activator protein AMA1
MFRVSLQEGVGVEANGLDNSSPVKPRKAVPVVPFRVLDAPSLRDDYYCSVLAYSDIVKVLAVGLGNTVYF